MIFCALAASSQSLGSSERAFNSSSLESATFQSKMPPQQLERGADVINDGLGFGLHFFS